ncbi:MAG: peptidase domain-containing ABC transporter [Chitinophaga sp.]|uniref:peptidase domain-containing ABC transporter n=1 Tax=Chitinophaga sp. TaxID=1869181 RepID=UPI0025BE210D|nr:peptidase domain-containing ABC transporter [Chitinophaga sp.]MBV8254760.1 peptidase domain-containing ABC transporter [Chitinophaga sp.]
MGKISCTIQHDSMDCAPSCLKMVAAYHGKEYDLEYLRQISFLNREGVSLLSLSEAAEKIGFQTIMVRATPEKLADDFPLPCILHWNQNHFVVLDKVKQNKYFFSKSTSENTSYIIADPAHGIVTLDKGNFLKSWISSGDQKGTALLMEPTPEFYTNKEVKSNKKGFLFLFNYLKPHKKYLTQLLIGMLGTSAISLVLPFLTQILVDDGVSNRNTGIIYLIFLSQLFLFLGSTAIDMIQSWLLLHVNLRISLSIISDFLSKLLQLPIRYFDTRAIGDISQRINDHHRIESFLTGTTLQSLFSLINIIVFTAVLGFYDIKLLMLFLLMSMAAVAWIFIFQNKRRQLDYKRFAQNKDNQDKLYEMISGMQEIKLYGSEKVNRWEWEHLQVKLFKLNIQSLALEQYQKTGFFFLSHLKNILISYIAATAVVNGELSLGVLLSISYIIGQTNSPLEQLVSFVKASQDARLSMDRIQEIQNQPQEDSHLLNEASSIPQAAAVKGSIILKDVSFQYEGPNSPFVLKNINMEIPEGKITAIVGASGSGKSTLMKLLLNFYQPVEGSITINDIPLSQTPSEQWREQCGTVMQDGYIFSDTIARNIALDGKPVDHARMQHAASVANIQPFIEGLPLGYTTKIGNNGIGISGGQRQRIFIARSVYKNPSYLFFDEATSSLDANNESIIVKQLNEFFKDKTVVIVAHRLSTVRNADQIIVLNDGQIVETGNHDTLVAKRNYYYELVKNQLELGN